MRFSCLSTQTSAKNLQSRSDRSILAKRTVDFARMEIAKPTSGRGFYRARRIGASIRALLKYHSAARLSDGETVVYRLKLGESRTCGVARTLTTIGDALKQQVIGKQRDCEETGF
jgi:hypothetical protein